MAVLFGSVLSAELIIQHPLACQLLCTSSPRNPCKQVGPRKIISASTQSFIDYDINDGYHHQNLGTRRHFIAGNQTAPTNLNGYITTLGELTLLVGGTKTQNTDTYKVGLYFTSSNHRYNNNNIVQWYLIKGYTYCRSEKSKTIGGALDLSRVEVIH